MKRLMAILATWLLSTLIAASCLTLAGLAAEAAEAAGAAEATELSGAHLFEIHCAGCHAQGGNIVRRGKTLKLKALQQYNMNSAEAIGQIVAQGKGNMSAYQNRLTPAEIQTVTDYVMQQASQGWKLPVVSKGS